MTGDKVSGPVPKERWYFLEVYCKEDTEEKRTCLWIMKIIGRGRMKTGGNLDFLRTNTSKADSVGGY